MGKKRFLLGLSLLLLGVVQPAHAQVQLCFRKADIFGGYVNHYWIRTSTFAAGMGPQEVVPEKDFSERGFADLIVKVAVVDHSNEASGECVDIEVEDTACLQEKLRVGRSLGYFGPLNNCFLFAVHTLQKCGARGENFKRFFDVSMPDNGYLSLGERCEGSQCLDQLDLAAFDRALSPASQDGQGRVSERREKLVLAGAPFELTSSPALGASSAAAR